MELGIRIGDCELGLRKGISDLALGLGSEIKMGELGLGVSDWVRE